MVVAAQPTTGRMQFHQVLDCAGPLALWHESSNSSTNQKSFPHVCHHGKAVEDFRTPRRSRDQPRRFRNSARSWTAPVLWRFDKAAHQRQPTKHPDPSPAQPTSPNLQTNHQISRLVGFLPCGKAPLIVINVLLWKHSVCFDPRPDARPKSNHPESLGLGFHAVPRRGTSVCRGDDRGRHRVQGPGHLEHGYHALHRLALSALGHQAVLESRGGHPQNQACLDLGHATCPRRRVGRSRFGAAGLTCLPILHGVLLAPRLQFRHPGHRD